MTTSHVGYRIFKALLTGAFALAAAGANAQPYPSKPVTLVVPYPAGGASDIMARAISKRMSEDLKQPVIVENIGGASGAIAARRVLGSDADGYYVYVGSANELILAPMVTATTLFKSEDFRLVGKVGDLTLAIITRGGLPVRNVEDLITLAKKRAQEKEPLTYGSVGIGSLYHLLGEKMSQLTDAPMTHVPYKGGTPMTQDLIGGQIDVYFGAMGASSTSYVSNGKLNLLAVISPERLDQFKSAPIATQTAPSLKDYSYSLWVGLFVKKGTPDPIVQSLNRALNYALADPSAKTAVEAAQVSLAKPQSADQADQDYATSIAKYRAIAASLNLKPQQ